MVAFGNEEHTKERKSETGFINPHIHHCSLRGRISSLTTAKVVLDFQSNQNGLNNTKGNKNIICTVVKYGKTFYDRNMAPNTSCSYRVK